MHKNVYLWNAIPSFKINFISNEAVNDNLISISGFHGLTARQSKIIEKDYLKTITDYLLLIDPDVDKLHETRTTVRGNQQLGINDP